MTSGVVFGVSGAPLWMRWLLFAVVAVVFQAMDVGTTMSLAASQHLAVPLWQVLVNGYSSVVMIILMYPPLRALCLAAHPWDGRPARMVGLHLAGFVAFFLVHLVGLLAIRAAVYLSVGHAFTVDLPGDAQPVLVRDAVTYAVIVGLMWLVLRLEARTLAPAPVAAGPRTFDIRDGGRVIRAPLASILAAQAAGNYVEFLLADGRRPLMRATMAAVEASLGPHGFVRTHRAWIVNATAVTALSPAGSGDQILTLAGGLEAPLSRRYRATAGQLLAS